MDQLDYDLIQTLGPKQAEKLYDDLQDNCEDVNINQVTLDPYYDKISKDEYKKVFKLFHNIIIQHGKDAHKEVDEIFEFVV